MSDSRKKPATRPENPDDTTDQESYHTPLGSLRELPRSSAPPSQEQLQSPQEQSESQSKPTPTTAQETEPTPKPKDATTDDNVELNKKPSAWAALRDGRTGSSSSQPSNSQSGRAPDGRIINWPESGCIHIPLREPGSKRSDDEENQEDE